MQSRLFDEMSTIDVGFDFTTDTKGYWDGFWEMRDGLGISRYDPDKESRTLRNYHRILWSRELPNGEVMHLENASSLGDYLAWQDYKFGSDSITASFRYKGNRALIEQVAASMDDYRGFMEDFIRRCYTIGGCIIFPKPHEGGDGRRTQSVNQARGRSSGPIRDRWDRTLECIRLHYLGEPNPLSGVLKEESWFFDKFVDFEGYVDFFLLQDCVTPDYSEVIPWVGDLDFRTPPLPGDVDEYIQWIHNNLEFVDRRNARIKRFIGTGVCTEVESSDPPN